MSNKCFTASSASAAIIVPIGVVRLLPMVGNANAVEIEAGGNSAAAGQDIPSSSSIMPAMTDSPPSQNFGSLASSPNGLSSSE
jgi:hypothetical protein